MSTYSSRNSNHSGVSSRREINQPVSSESSISTSTRLSTTSTSHGTTTSTTTTTTTTSNRDSSPTGVSVGHLEYENSSGDFMKTKIKRKTAVHHHHHHHHNNNNVASSDIPSEPHVDDLKPNNSSFSSSRSSKRRMGRSSCNSVSNSSNLRPSSTTNSSQANSSITTSTTMPAPLNNGTISHDPYEFSEPKFEVPTKKSKLDRPENSDSARSISNHSCDSGRVTVGTNTVSVETMTEEECFGPCLPGTQVNLNAIVWLETTGLLVVNIPWRGRTYVGTLLDCTQHHYAPTNLYTYQPPYETRVPYRGRGKRRNFGYNLNGRNSRGGGKNRPNVSGNGKRNSGIAMNSTTGNCDSKSTVGVEEACDIEEDSVKGYLHDDSPTNSVYNFAEVARNDDASGEQSMGNIATSTNAGNQNNEPAVFECPWPECHHRFTKLTALRYHQGHSHSPLNNHSPSSSSRKATHITLRLTSPSSPKSNTGTNSGSKKSPHKRKQHSQHQTQQQQQSSLEDMSWNSGTVKMELSEQCPHLSSTSQPLKEEFLKDGSAADHAAMTPKSSSATPTLSVTTSQPPTPCISINNVDDGLMSSAVLSTVATSSSMLKICTTSANQGSVAGTVSPQLSFSTSQTTPRIVSAPTVTIPLEAGAPSLSSRFPPHVQQTSSAGRLPPGVNSTSPAIAASVSGANASTQVFYNLPSTTSIHSTTTRQPLTTIVPGTHIFLQPTSLSKPTSSSSETISPSSLSRPMAQQPPSQQQQQHAILKSIQPRPPVITSALSSSVTTTNISSASSKKRSRRSPPPPPVSSCVVSSKTSPSSLLFPGTSLSCTKSSPPSLSTQYLPLSISLPSASQENVNGMLSHMNGLNSSQSGNLSIPHISPVGLPAGPPTVQCQDAPRSPAYSDISDPNDEPLPVLEKEEDFRSPGACDRNSALLYQQPPPSLVPAVVSTADLPGSSISVLSTGQANSPSPYLTSNGSIILDSQNVKTTVAFGTHLSVSHTGGSLEEDERHRVTTTPLSFYSSGQQNTSPHFRLSASMLPSSSQSTSPLTFSTGSATGASGGNHSIFVPSHHSVFSNSTHASNISQHQLHSQSKLSLPTDLRTNSHQPTLAVSSGTTASLGNFHLSSASHPAISHATVLHLNASSGITSAAGGSNFQTATGIPISVSTPSGTYVLSSSSTPNSNLPQHLTLFQQK